MLDLHDGLDPAADEQVAFNVAIARVEGGDETVGDAIREDSRRDGVRSGAQGVRPLVRGSEPSGRDRVMVRGARARRSGARQGQASGLSRMVEASRPHRKPSWSRVKARGKGSGLWSFRGAGDGGVGRWVKGGGSKGQAFRRLGLGSGLGPGGSHLWPHAPSSRKSGFERAESGVIRRIRRVRPLRRLGFRSGFGFGFRFRQVREGQALGPRAGIAGGPDSGEDSEGPGLSHTQFYGLRGFAECVRWADRSASAWFRPASVD
jgi:hypothetical protein